MRLASGAQVFSLGELWSGSDGMPCQHEGGCANRTRLVLLSPAESAELLSGFSHDENCRDGVLGGPSVALAICQRKLGQVLCKNHLPDDKPALV